MRQCLVSSFYILLVVVFSATSILAQDLSVAWDQARYLKNLEGNKENLEELLLNEKNFYGIEVIVAAATTDRWMSAFGHVSVRFVGSGPTFDTDWVLSFEANIDGPDFDEYLGVPGYVKGIVGSYEVIPSVRSLEHHLRIYSRNESRPLYRVVIPTNQRQRTSLLSVLQYWMSTDIGDSKHPLNSYIFAKTDCIRVLMKFLEEAGLSAKGALGSGVSKEEIGLAEGTDTVMPGAVAPVDAADILRQELLNPFLAVEISSFGPILDQAAKILGLKRAALEVSKNWPADGAEKLFRSGISYPYLKRIYDLPYFPYGQLGKLFSLLADAGFVEDERLLKGVREIPKSLYQLCINLACAEQVRDASREFWQWKFKNNTLIGETVEVADDEWRMAFRPRMNALMNYDKKYLESDLRKSVKNRPHYNHWNLLMSVY